MKSLSSPGDLAEIRTRIELLSPTDTRRWGSMSVQQMICHLSDAFSCPLLERTVAPFKGYPLPTPIFKWVALRLPRKWPPGVPTPPEIDQLIQGTPPTDFAADHASLLDRFDRFVRANGPWVPHPMFGPMTRDDWMRWGYLHTDHHLRQFGR